jgi:hypothetical protein
MDDRNQKQHFKYLHAHPSVDIENAIKTIFIFGHKRCPREWNESAKNIQSVFILFQRCVKEHKTNSRDVANTLGFTIRAVDNLKELLLHVKLDSLIHAEKVEKALAEIVLAFEEIVFILRTDVQEEN